MGASTADVALVVSAYGAPKRWKHVSVPHTPADSIQFLGRAAGVTTWNGHHPR
jgi:hypothetical protein